MILDVEFWGSRLSFTSTGEVAQGMSSELNMIRFGILLKVNLYKKLLGEYYYIQAAKATD